MEFWNSFILILNWIINSQRLCFICLFVWSFSSHSIIFHSFGYVTIAGEGLQILTYARHLWPLSSEGSFACHIYCDTGHPFIVVISEDPADTHTYCLAFGRGVVTICFNLGLSRLGFEHPTFRLRGERSNSLRHRHGQQKNIWIQKCTYELLSGRLMQFIFD